MKVTLARRWGPHPEGNTVEVDDVQGTWLIRHNYGHSTADVVAPVQVAAAPGTNGPDPLAGGDATRRRPRIPRSKGSTADPVPGSPPVYRAGYNEPAVPRRGRALPVDTEKPAKHRSSDA